MNLQINHKFIKAETEILAGGDVMVSLTPPRNEDYWILRVPVSDSQAIVAFPKFCVIGVGFQIEEEWFQGCDLPTGCDAQTIYDHIKKNKGDDAIPDDTCIKAIQLIKDTVAQMRATGELEF